MRTLIFLLFPLIGHSQIFESSLSKDSLKYKTIQFINECYHYEPTKWGDLSGCKITSYEVDTIISNIKLDGREVELKFIFTDRKYKLFIDPEINKSSINKVKNKIKNYLK
jgi:hypothetical protein